MVDTYVLRSPDAVLDDPYASLTERERRILLLAAVGLHDRVELLRDTVRRGLLNPSIP